jgi:hypothetical protein
MYHEAMRLPVAMFASAVALMAVVGCGSNPGEDASGTSTAPDDDGGTTTTTGTNTDPPAACGTIVGEGYTVGQVAENWSLPSNLGAMVELMGYCGKVIFYEEGSIW